MADREQPSPPYVFVVLSLAAFLTLFTLFCSRKTIYETYADIRLSATESQQAARTRREQMSDLTILRDSAAATLLNAESIFEALKHANMLGGDRSPEKLQISKDIASRMRVDVIDGGNDPKVQLALVTENPAAGIRLLDSMLHDFQSISPAAIDYSPAMISRCHGGSVSSLGLLQLSFVSAIAGCLGLALLYGSTAGSTLFSDRQVSLICGLPVIAHVGDATDMPIRDKRLVRSRALRVSLRTAELVVAAVFALMVYHLATKGALMTRFVDDPLATYGEVLARFVG